MSEVKLYTVTILEDPKTKELKVSTEIHVQRSGKEFLMVLSQVARAISGQTLELGLRLGLTEEQAIAVLEGPDSKGGDDES